LIEINIKRETGLATTVNNTYINFTSNTISDMEGNAVLEIPPEEEVSVHIFTPDGARPTLRAFDFDLTLEVLTLYFSETVNIATLNETQDHLAQY